MPRINEYKAPEAAIQPSSKGYEAAMISGRRIAALRREGTEDLRRGIASIGSALEQAEARAQRKEAKAQAKSDKEEARAERYADKVERNLDKRDREEATRKKAEDKEQGRQELVRAYPEHAKLMKDLADEKAMIEQKTEPVDLPAALKEFNERAEKRLQQFREQYATSKTGGDKIDTWLSHDRGDLYYTTKASSNKAMGDAVMAQIHKAADIQARHLLDHPEDGDKVRKDFVSGFNDIVSHTPEGAVNGQPMIAKTPEDVTPEMLDTFRTLEGNKDGHLDTAVSPKGALGRNQIMPETGKGAGFPDENRLRYDREYNDGAAKVVISELSNRYHGDTEAMAIAYNGGPKHADAWLKAGRDDSVLPGETQGYVKRLRDMGQGSGPLSSLATNLQVKKSAEKGLEELTAAEVHGMARVDPPRAREMLKDPNRRQYLSPKYLDPLSPASLDKAIGNYERVQEKQRVHDQLRETKGAEALSTQKTVDYLRQMHNDKGEYIGTPKDWGDKVMHDPQLRDEERRGLIQMQARLADQHEGKGTSFFGLIGTEKGKVESLENASNPDTVQAILGSYKPADRNSISFGGGPTPASDILARISSTDPNAHTGQAMNLTVKDAELLLSFQSPSSPYGAEAAGKLHDTIKGMHDTLAPANPDGTPNVAGEKAYRQAVGDIIPEYRARAQQGGAISALDPNSPEYLLKDNRIQKYAPTHKDLTTSAVAPAERVPLDNIFDWQEAPAPTTTVASMNSPAPDMEIDPNDTTTSNE